MKLYLLLSSCILLAGCGGGSGTHSVYVGGVTITVVQPAGDHQWTGTASGNDLTDKDAVSGLEFALKDKQLSVNGKSYGTVATGDKVQIEGKEVLVNGKPRPPN